MERDNHHQQQQTKLKLASPGRQARCRSLPSKNSAANNIPRKDPTLFPPTTKRRNKCSNNALKERKLPKAQAVYLSPSVEERLADLGMDSGKKAAAFSNIVIAGDGDLHNLNAKSNPKSESPRSFRASNGRNEGESSSNKRDVPPRETNERKSARLISNISRRISEISTSVDLYDRSVRNVNDTLQEAYRKSIQDQIKSRQASSTLLKSRTSSPRLNDSSEDLILKCKESLNEVNSNADSTEVKCGTATSEGMATVPSSARDRVRKIFGLDATPFLKSSSSGSSSLEDEVIDRHTSPEDSSSEEDGAAMMRSSRKAPRKPTKSETLKRFEENIKTKAKQSQSTSRNRPSRSTVKRRKHRRQRSTKDVVPRSLSPIMPSLPDKQFQTMLKRREERATRQLNTMKNGLAQLNHKVELDKKKADLMQHSYKGRSASLSRTDRRLNGNPLFVIWNNVINSN